jgi:hypothetical protein
MSVRVANVGHWERNTSGERTTNLTTSFGDQGTVRTTVEGIEYVFGPGEVKSFSDNGLGAKIAASDARLRVADDREGNWKSNASLSVTRW